jgi:Arc/MetJ-type ribon-helix-helix transcriptional regulator
MSMRITVRLPDELGEEVKRRTDNVSRYVRDALTEKIQREERRQARQDLLDMAGEGTVDPSVHHRNQKTRREGDRLAPSNESGRTSAEE